MSEVFLGGATLDSWRFDFKKEDGVVISGKLSDEVNEQDAQRMIALTGVGASATLKEIGIQTTEGIIRYRFELTRLSASSPGPQIDQ